MELTKYSSWRLRHRHSVARFFLLLFTAMLVNGVVFRHGHRLADGRIISHAHPFKSQGKGPIQPNSHTSLELLLLDAVSNPVLDLPGLEVIDFQVIEEWLPIRQNFPIQHLFRSFSFVYFSHRGPPGVSE